MRKIHFIIAATGMLAMAAMTSCNKKEATAPASISQATNHSRAITAKSGTGYYSKDHADGCYGEGAECAQSGPIVIHPPKFFASMTTAINGSPTVVASVFNDQDIADFCNQFMDPYMLTELQSGNYYVSLGYDGPTTVSYRVGLTSPVTLANEEFAFQVNK